MPQRRERVEEAGDRQVQLRELDPLEASVGLRVRDECRREDLEHDLELARAELDCDGAHRGREAAERASAYGLVMLDVCCEITA